MTQKEIKNKKPQRKETTIRAYPEDITLLRSFAKKTGSPHREVPESNADILHRLLQFLLGKSDL